MKRKLNVAGRIVEIEAYDDDCAMNQWGWNCRFVGTASNGRHICKLFRVWLRPGPDVHPLRALACKRAEIPPPPKIGGGFGGGNAFGATGMP